MRLIDADALIDKIGDRKYDITKVRGGYKYCNLEEKNDWDTLDEFEDVVDDAPTVESKVGEWIINKFYCWECSVCGENPMKGTGYTQSREELFDYCPYCGAYMGSETNEIN